MIFKTNARSRTVSMHQIQYHRFRDQIDVATWKTRQPADLLPWNCLKKLFNAFTLDFIKPMFFGSTFSGFEKFLKLGCFGIFLKDTHVQNNNMGHWQRVQGLTCWNVDKKTRVFSHRVFGHRFLFRCQSWQITFAKLCPVLDLWPSLFNRTAWQPTCVRTQTAVP